MREMLRSVAASHGAILQAEDFLDDGSRIRLQVPLTSRPPRFTNPPGVPSPPSDGLMNRWRMGGGGWVGVTSAVCPGGARYVSQYARGTGHV